MLYLWVKHGVRESIKFLRIPNSWKNSFMKNAKSAYSEGLAHFLMTVWFCKGDFFSLERRTEQIYWV